MLQVTEAQVKQKVKLKVKSKDELSTFEVNHYINQFIKAYVKIYLIEQMSMAYIREPYTQFVMEAHSISDDPNFNLLKKSEIYRLLQKNCESKTIVLDELEGLRLFQNKNLPRCTFGETSTFEPLEYFGKNDRYGIQNFFHYFDILDMPLIYKSSGNDNRTELMYSYWGEEAIKLTRLSHNCPPEICFVCCCISVAKFLIDVHQSTTTTNSIKELTKQLDNAGLKYTAMILDEDNNTAPTAVKNSISNSIYTVRNNYISVCNSMDIGKVIDITA